MIIDELETRIGSRWLLYVGVVAIIVGVGYFEKLAIDNGWISEAARVIQGAVAGLLLIAAGLRFVRKGYSVYGQILCGAGIAILYVSTYAAFNFYHLLSQPLAFSAMSAITMLAAWLADRQRSQQLALVAVGGGFATPFLLPATTDAQVALFGYDAILIAGTMFLSRRRDWPILNVVSYAATVLTIFAWAAEFYTPAKYLTTELFLTLYCAMFLYILGGPIRSERATAKAERAVLSTAPVGYYVLSLVILAEHSTAFLIYLVLLSLVGVLVCTRFGSSARFGFWLATAAPLLLWSAGNHEWLVGGVAVWTGIWMFNLLGVFKATVWQPRRFAATDIALLHLNTLAAYVGAYLLIDPVHPTACAPLAAALALLHGGIGGLLMNRFRDEALHFWALAFALLTIAIGMQFDSQWVTSAWAAEAAAVAWLALRERRKLLRAAGLLLFVVACVQFVVMQFARPIDGEMLLLNEWAMSGLFIIALTYLLALAHHRNGIEPDREIETGVLLLGAKLLAFATAAGEIVAYWSRHPAPPFQPAAHMIVAALTTGAVIMWLGLRRQQEWLRAAGGAVVAVPVIALFDIQLHAAPAAYVSLVNARVGAGLFAVLLFCGLAAIHRRMGAHVRDLSVNIAIFTTCASLLTLSLLTSEIDAYWAARGAGYVWSIAREGLQVIAWGGIGGFLVWQGLSSGRSWVRAIGGVLLAASVLRLLRLQIIDVQPTYVIVANARVMASLVIIATLYGLAHLYRRAADVVENQWAPATTLLLIANALTLILLTGEITAYWHVHDVRHVTASTSATGRFAREMMLSITWAVYATLLIVVGLRRRYAPIRYFAMAVFAITIVKVFAIDLAQLDRLYRVLSVLALGVTLLLTSYLYQKLNGDTTTA